MTGAIIQKIRSGAIFQNKERAQIRANLVQSTPIKMHRSIEGTSLIGSGIVMAANGVRKKNIFKLVESVGNCLPSKIKVTKSAAVTWEDPKSFIRVQ